MIQYDQRINGHGRYMMVHSCRKFHQRVNDDTTLYQQVKDDVSSGWYDNMCSANHQVKTINGHDFLTLSLWDTNSQERYNLTDK
jgi:hypothetical protein